MKDEVMIDPKFKINQKIFACSKSELFRYLEGESDYIKRPFVISGIKKVDSYKKGPQWKYNVCDDLWIDEEEIFNSFSEMKKWMLKTINDLKNSVEKMCVQE